MSKRLTPEQFVSLKKVLTQLREQARDMPTRLVYDLSLDALAELDAVRADNKELREALVHAERNLGLLCRCVPGGYQCSLCHARAALEKTR